jgi:flagellar assembly factor FliW
MTTITTKRFGNIPANEEHFIRFKDGMIGMSVLKQYILIESSSYPLILWLQSCQDPGIAFPVMEPAFFKRDYKVHMTDADRACLKFEEGDRIKFFVVMTIPDNTEDMTVNLKAPVAINLDKGTATQVILQDKELQVRSPAYADFVKTVAQLSDESNDFGQGEDTWAPISISGGQTELREAQV